MAAGHIDLVVEAGLKNVDICPLIPLIQNAGGVVTTWDGGPAEQGGNCVAAATPELHAAAMAVLRGTSASAAGVSGCGIRAVPSAMSSPPLRSDSAR